MKALLPVALILGMGFCSTEQNVNVITGPSTGGNGSNGSQCASLATSVNVDVESGLTSGFGVVSQPLVFSADPRDAAGNSLSAVCRTGVVDAKASGACVTIQGTPTLENITTTPTATGACRVDVTFGGVVGSRTVTVN